MFSLESWDNGANQSLLEIEGFSHYTLGASLYLSWQLGDLGSTLYTLDLCFQPPCFSKWRSTKRGLSPQETNAATIKNLHAKTVNSRDRGLQLLHQSKLTEKTLSKAHLIETHGVGHFQAQTIVNQFIADK